MHLDVPRTKLKPSGDLAFSVATIKIVEQFPLQLRSACAAGSFKSTLKTFLYSKAFNLGCAVEHSTIYCPFDVLISWYTVFVLFFNLFSMLGNIWLFAIVLYKWTWIDLCSSTASISLSTDHAFCLHQGWLLVIRQDQNCNLFTGKKNFPYGYTSAGNEKKRRHKLIILWNEGEKWCDSSVVPEWKPGWMPSMTA